MTAEAILAELLECGIEPGLTPDGTGIEVPAGRLTDAQRNSIRDCKADLITCIQESARITSDLLQAAMRCCDYHGDGDKARAEMRAQCLEIPPQLRGELRAYFDQMYTNPLRDM